MIHLRTVHITTTKLIVHLRWKLVNRDFFNVPKELAYQAVGYAITKKTAQAGWTK